MKKAFITALFTLTFFGFSQKSFSQSVNAVKTKAISATIQAGYAPTPMNKITANSTVIGTCGTTCNPKTKYEIFVSPKSTTTTRMAPYAKVTMCGLTVLSIENLRN